MTYVRQIRVLHVVRRFVSPDLVELNTGYEIEHFKAMSQLMLSNSVIFQSRDGRYHEIKISNLTFYLVPSLLSMLIFTYKLSKNHDLVVAQNPFLAGFISTLVGFMRRRPVIIGVFGVKFTVKRFQFFLKNFVCSKATRIRANSHAVKNTIISWGIDASKIVVIEDRVDCTHFNPDIDGSPIRKKLGITGKMVLSVGSLIEIKGFDTLLEAAKRVLESINEVTFVIVGNGPLKEKLIKQSEDLHIKEHVIFLKNVTSSEMPLYYAACDVVVHPSHIEAMGRVILEAEASAKPLIANRVGGIPEAVTENSAILLEPKNHVSLAEAIKKLLKNNQLCLQMGLAGRNLVKNKFEFWKQEEKLISFYNETIEMHKMS